MQVSTKIIPGHDCRYAECQHTPKGDHGIGGSKILHIVRHELADGRRVALELEIFTQKYPDTVPVHITREAPECSRLQLHVQVPAGGSPPLDHSGTGVPCQVLADDQTNCYVPWDTYEVDAFQSMIGVPKDEKHSDFYYNLALAPGDSFWIAMRNKLRVLLADAALFTQDDETQTMGDVRARYDQAYAGLVAAQAKWRAAQRELESAILDYKSGHPGFKRRS